MSVTGTGIAGNSAIQTITNGTTFTVSLATIALGTASTLTFNAALTSAGTAIYLDEYLPGTALQTLPNYTVTLPSSGSAGIVAGGATASSGAISRSENGRYILVPGWSTGAGGAAIGAPNTSNILCAVKPISGSGSIQTGITGASNWFTAANDFRDVTSEDLTNYWLSGASIGIRTTTNGTALTTISTTSTNTRSVNIINGQLYYSTWSETQGVYKVGLGKPTATSTTSVNLTTSTGAYGFALSPDFLTLYTNSATRVISRFTYSGKYNAGSGTPSGGLWSAASTGITLSGATGVAVDWSGYTFGTGANVAVIYVCNATMLVKGNDNGTGAVATTTLATLTGLNTFKQIAFSPIQQTVAKGLSTPGTGNITANTNNNALFQINLAVN